MDNSFIHNPKVSRVKLSQTPVHLAFHRPSSRDQALSDVFLFGYLKRTLLGRDFDFPDSRAGGMSAGFQRILGTVLEGIQERDHSC
jgi:hypothetical protein